jgi:hypothetical protein
MKPSPPDLPDRVGAVAQEIAPLQALLDLFKEHFDLRHIE